MKTEGTTAAMMRAERAAEETKAAEAGIEAAAAEAAVGASTAVAVVRATATGTAAAGATGLVLWEQKDEHPIAP